MIFYFVTCWGDILPRGSSDDSCAPILSGEWVVDRISQIFLAYYTALIQECLLHQVPISLVDLLNKTVRLLRALHFETLGSAVQFIDLLLNLIGSFHIALFLSCLLNIFISNFSSASIRFFVCFIIWPNYARWNEEDMIDGSSFEDDDPISHSTSFIHFFLYITEEISKKICKFANI